MAPGNRNHAASRGGQLPPAAGEGRQVKAPKIAKTRQAPAQYYKNKDGRLTKQLTQMGKFLRNSGGWPPSKGRCGAMTGISAMSTNEVRLIVSHAAAARLYQHAP